MTTIKIETLENIKDVKPIRAYDDNITKKIKGSDIYPLYCNIYIAAKKRSGKTSLIYNIIKETANKHTTIYLFCPTFYNDEAYKCIKQYCESKDINLIQFNSLIDYNERGKKIDNLKNIIDTLLTQTNEEEEDKPTKKQNKRKICLFNNDSESEEEEKEEKIKEITNENLFIFDDINEELKNKSIDTLLKKHRHLKSKCIISTQYYLDVLPSQRAQFDYIILFKNLNDKTLEKIYKDIDFNIDYDKFKKIYLYISSFPYNFMYIDKNKDEIRQNFNRRIIYN